MEAVNRIDSNRWQLRAAHKVHVVAGIHQMRSQPLHAICLRLPRLEGFAAAQRALDGPAAIRRHRGSRPQTHKGTKNTKKARRNGALSMRRARGILRHYMLYDECNHIKRQHHGQLNVIHTFLC